MSGYTLRYSERAVKDISKLSPQIKQRLGKKLEWFGSQSDPLQFAEPLTKPADAQYRFRVGDYRVLFDVDSTTLTILHVQHRRQVYRR